MQLIKNIEIAYFRSFYKEVIFECCDLNVIFGKNDVGKSNIVRALNLFFNNETDYNTELDFELDFADARKVDAESSEDIRKFLYVKITFNTPINYQKSLGKEFYVKRQWTVSRGSEFIEESSNHIKSNQKHIITRFINLIKFIYVPAIKDASIFQNLLRDVYFCVVKRDEFSEAIERFARDVRAGTSGMFAEMDAFIGSSTRISAPTRLEELFQTLDFETSKDDSSYPKSLTLQRGDGVKVRHIPELLRFISSNDGLPYHIWGFEEPENSLDFSSSSSEAERFRTFSQSSEVQVFLTTHNPAFYNVSAQSGVKRIYVRSSNRGSSIISGKSLDKESVESLMDEGFFLPAIAERLKDAQERINALKEKIDYIRSEKHELTNLIRRSERPTVVVEGECDKIILEGALDRYGGKDRLSIVSAGGSGNLDIFRSRREVLKSIFRSKEIMIIVDNDRAGHSAMPDELRSSNNFKSDKNGYYWRTLPLLQNHSDILKKFNQNSPFFAIEDMFVSSTLRGAVRAGVLAYGQNFRPGVETKSRRFHQLFSEHNEYEPYLLEVDSGSKIKFAKWVCEQDWDRKEEEAFRSILNEIEQLMRT